MNLATPEMEGGKPDTRTAVGGGGNGPWGPAAASLWVMLEGVGGLGVTDCGWVGDEFSRWPGFLTSGAQRSLYPHSTPLYPHLLPL